MTFVYTQKVKFKHCDPAGIVFYPRYFEMMNDTVEAFFDDVVDLSFAKMHGKGGVPTVQIEASFTAPSRLGDVLEISLAIKRVGRSSLDLGYRAMCGSEQRFIATSTIVMVAGAGKPQPWPDGLRTMFKTMIEETAP